MDYKYECNNPECDYKSKLYFGLCPKCHNGEGIEIVEEKVPNNDTFNQLFDQNIKYKKIQFKQVNPNEDKVVARIKTQFPDFNSVLSSVDGLVDSQVVLLGAEPGTGKSTLMSQIANNNSLYISSEESYSQVNNRMLRVNPNSKAQLLTTTKIDDVMNAINQTTADLILIDSINSIEFGVGYQTTAKYVNAIIQSIKALNKICIIVSQVAKGGEISGMNSIVHLVDTVLHMERSQVSTNNILLTSSKNRFGEVGQVAGFQHTNKGLVQISLNNEKLEPEEGVTYTETRFGRKNLTIGIEALATRVQSNYPVRRVNGYNFNRFIQLIGVLQSQRNINLMDSDIYLNISNGLSTSDTSIELAIINSILSSFKHKTLITKAYGELRLNGKIINGSIEINGKKQKIYDLKELIKLYIPDRPKEI